MWEAGICCGELLALATAAADAEGSAADAAASDGEGFQQCGRRRRGAVARGAATRVLEIGSGTGIAGLAAALLGGDVTLSDQRNIVPLLERNIEANAEAMRARGGRAGAVVMDWDNQLQREKLVAGGPYALVLCSDLVFGNAFENLIRLLAELQATPTGGGAGETAGGVHTHILFALQRREERFPSPGFFAALREVFALRPVGADEWPAARREAHAETELFWLELL